MKTNLLRKWLGPIVLLGAFAAISFAQTPPVLNTKSKDSLRGLDRVRIVIDISSREERQGLSTSQLYEMVGERLRMAGIRMIDKTESLATEGNPTLYVKLMVFRTRNTEYAWLTDVQLRQEVTPKRQPSVSEMAATWQNSAIGFLGGVLPDTAVGRILDGTGSIVDWFIRDCQSVNPK